MPVQQAAIMKGAVGAGDGARQQQPQTIGAHNGGSQQQTSGGPMYSSTSYDDNFADNKNTIAQQFGFLPSILKSFY